MISELGCDLKIKYVLPENLQISSFLELFLILLTLLISQVKCWWDWASILASKLVRLKPHGSTSLTVYIMNTKTNFLTRKIILARVIEITLWIKSLFEVVPVHRRAPPCRPRTRPCWYVVVMLAAHLYVPVRRVRARTSRPQLAPPRGRFGQLTYSKLQFLNGKANFSLQNISKSNRYSI